MTPRLCCAVTSVFLGAVFAHHLRVARAPGRDVGAESDAYPGPAPPLQQLGVQRVGAALQVDPRFHALVIDAVYVTERPSAEPASHPAPPLTDRGVARV